MSSLIRLKQTDTDIVGVDGTRAFTSPQGGVAPVADADLSTKGYVDSVAAGLKVIADVRVRAQGNVILATDAENGDTIDGVVLATGDRIACFNQTTVTQDGVYEVQATGAAVRVADLPAAASAASIFFFVQEGTDADIGFVCTNDVGTDVVGTDDLILAQFSSLSFSGGAGIDVTGSTISADLLASGGLKDVSGETAVEPADFAGSGLEDDGSDNLRIATGAYGNGFTAGSGGGTAAAVGAGNGITVNAADVAVNPADLETGGAAEFDADKADIDFTPSNYTPSTAPAEADNLDNLTAHLAGIDNALAASTSPQTTIIAGTVFTTDTVIVTLSPVPVDVTKVQLYMNGLLMKYGASFDFDVDGSGNVTVRAGTGTACDSDTNDEYIAYYEA